MQPPPASVFQAVIVSAQRPGVRAGGGPALPVVNGVIEIGTAGRGSASRVNTRAIPDLDMAAQHRPGEPGGGVLSGPFTPTNLGGLGRDVGHYPNPFTAGIQISGELGEQSGGQVQLDDPASTRRQLTIGALGCDAGGSAAGDTRNQQLPSRVGEGKAPFGGALRDHQGPGDLRGYRTPPGDLTGIPVTPEQRRQCHPQLYPHPPRGLRCGEATHGGHPIPARFRAVTSTIIGGAVRWRVASRIAVRASTTGWDIVARRRSGGMVGVGGAVGVSVVVGVTCGAGQ